MAKKTSQENDEARLTIKTRERRVSAENPEGDAALRALRKRLKRVQRKRRRLEARKRRARGKVAAAAAKTEAPAGT